MTCPDARELCSALLDEALAPAERAALDEHLAGCADCRRELDRLRATVSLIKAAGPVRAPAGFVDRVLEAARPVPWYRRVATRLFRPLSVKVPVQAAAVVLISVAAVYVFQRTPELQQAARQESAPRPEPRQAPDAGSRPPDAGRAPGSAREADAPATAEKRSRAITQAEEPVPQRDADRSGANVHGAGPPASPAPLLRSPASELAKDQVAGADAPPESKKSHEPVAPGAIMRSAPAEGPPGGGARERQDRSAPPLGARAESSADARVAARPPDVLARLAADDRDLANRTLAAILARVGGAELSRRVEAGATVIEVTVPREAYTEIARELAQIGRFTIDRAPTTLPAHVVVNLRLTP